MSKIITPEETVQRIRDFAENSAQGITIIIGAGASYGYSKDNLKPMPPLVTELLKDSNPIVKIVIERTEHSLIKIQRSHIVRRLNQFNNDLEAYLTDLYKKDRENNLFSHFLLYLQDLFVESSKNIDLNDNNFQDLINILADWRGIKPTTYISFNYDTLLEQSISSVSRFIPPKDFSTQETYTSRYPKILKMHGGVNFRYTFDEEYSDLKLSAHDIFNKMMNDSASNLSIIEPGINLPIPIQDISSQGRLITRYDFPLMMIPIHGSISPENSFFKEQLERAKEEISKSGLLIVIGYNFGDEMFINAINSLAPIDSEVILVGANDLLIEETQHRSYQNAKKIWDEDNISIFGSEGFESFVEALYL